MTVPERLARSIDLIMGNYVQNTVGEYVVAGRQLLWRKKLLGIIAIGHRVPRSPDLRRYAGANQHLGITYLCNVLFPHYRLQLHG